MLSQPKGNRGAHEYPFSPAVCKAYANGRASAGPARKPVNVSVSVAITGRGPRGRRLCCSSRAMAERLQRYREMRDFSITPEPRGPARATSKKRLRYYIQRHAATRLHYDFRLELEGVLKSWAVPKGPSLDPADKRLAMHVEDHPLEYGSFEGIIPKGEYGGGTVLLWDRGTWTPEGDPHRAYRAGNLKFSLAGDKLRGSWALVRIRDRRQARDDERSWLLIKHDDEAARPAARYQVVEQEPDSVATGRSMEEIAAARD